MQFLHVILRWSSVAALAAAAGLTAAAPAHADQAGIRHAGGPTAIPGSYIVVLDDTAVARSGVDRTALDLTERYGGTVGYRYAAALRGFSVQATEATARQMAADPAVASVEQNHAVRLPDTQAFTPYGTQPNPPSWGLDRIDQRNLPLDNSYTYPDSGGADVHAYIVDTGIRLSHNDFGGRAITGIDLVDGGAADDCQGHGTHIAGTLGGTTFGVAKNVTLVAVRAYDCSFGGSIARTVAGIDWVAANAEHPAVANLSLSRPHDTDPTGAYATATTGLINSGVTAVVSAGNDAGDACDVTPSHLPAAITVGYTWPDDVAAHLSNHGPCVDLFAPGYEIVSAGIASDTAQEPRTGTSMAAPHVAGAAALILDAHPTWTPAQVHGQVVSNATTGVVTGARPNTTDRLLYVPPS